MFCRTGARYYDLMHITDWYPTLLSAAGADPATQRGLDGVDQWAGLRAAGRGVAPPNTGAGARTSLVYNLKILPVSGAVREGQHKLMFAPKFNKDGWYDIDSRGPENIDAVDNNKYILIRQNDKIALNYTNMTQGIFGVTPDDENDDDDDGADIERSMLHDMKLQQHFNQSEAFQRIFDRRWPHLKKHLFNIVDDPEERTDLQEEQPELMETMRLRARELYGSMVERDYPPFSKKSNPKNFGGVWSPGWC